MPIYEYHCNACGRKPSIFQRRMGVEIAAACPDCGSADLRRLISRFAVVRSTGDAFDDSGLEGLDPDDPESMERWAREMGEDPGAGFDDDGLDDFGPDE